MIDREECPELQAWMNENMPEEKMYYYAPALDQMIFVRDALALLFTPPDTHERHIVRVVGTHMSKSILLPVYSLANDTLEIRIRYNFYDWILSVKADPPIDVEFGSGLFTPGAEVRSIFAGGFETEWIFGPPSPDYLVKQFTVSPHNQYALWAMVYLVTEAQKSHG